jgi:hypothetical protein
LENIKTNFNIIVKIKQSQKEDLEKQIDKLDTLVKGSIAYDVLNNQNIKDWKEEKGKKQKELGNIEIVNKEKTTEIERLKNEKSNYADFAEFLNQILKDLSINLKIELSGKDYVLKHSLDKNSLPIEEISEGERNLLALLFFYYELFNDKEQQSIKNLDLIIIDDPISSLDHTNRMYILEIMKRLLDCDMTSQIFILTHSWEDFCDLCYMKEDRESTSFRFMEVKKNDGKSFLTRIKKPQSPYKHHFLEIFELSERANTDNLTDCEIYHFPNIMRSVLEEFLRFKATKATPTKTNENIIGKILFNREWNNISNENKTKLGQLLNICNILSHNLSRNPDEVLSSAKFLMNRIKEVDINHFNTNKESNG